MRPKRALPSAAKRQWAENRLLCPLPRFHVCDETFRFTACSPSSAEIGRARTSDDIGSGRWREEGCHVWLVSVSDGARLRPGTPRAPPPSRARSPLLPPSNGANSLSRGPSPSGRCWRAMCGAVGFGTSCPPSPSRAANPALSPLVFPGPSALQAHCPAPGCHCQRDRPAS